MAELTIAQIIDKNKIASDRVWLYALKVYLMDASRNPVGDFKIARNNENVTIDGEVYSAFPFELDRNDSGSELGNLRVTIQDQLGVIQTYMGQYRGLIGFTVEVIVADFNAGTSTSTSSVTEVFQVVSSSCNDYVATFELGAENPLRLLVPKRLQFADRCSFRFKSTECGYVGVSTTCDFTLTGANGCEAHANQQRFGAFPGLVIRG